MRRGATRALPEQGGLGFAMGGQRLDGMTLTPRGDDLVADTLGTNVWHRQILREWLSAWAAGEAPNTGDTALTRLLEGGGGRRGGGKGRGGEGGKGEEGRRGRSTALGPFTATQRERQVVLAV